MNVRASAAIVLLLLQQPPIAGVAQDTLPAALTDREFWSLTEQLVDHLTRTRRFPLGADDLAGIEYVSANFHRFGPAINYTSATSPGRKRCAPWAPFSASAARP